MIYDARDDAANHPPEIVVGAGKLTAIFFAAALVCGACFGFGYSLGRHSAAKAAEAVAVPVSAPSTDLAAANKPMPGAEPAAAVADGTSDANEEVVVAPPQPAAAAKSAPDVASPSPAAAATGSYVVQVAAVSRPRDASILVAALQRKGYKAGAASSEQDHLVHVQVGPFSNAKDAHAAQDRLANDGYAALIK